MKLPNGIAMIKAERRRQITKEKWTAKHDDEHFDFSLSAAARCYERCAHFQENCGRLPPEATKAFIIQPRDWPWDAHWFKLGRSPIRTLVKSGALFQAEVDRIDRIKRKRQTLTLGPEFTGVYRGAVGGVARIARIIDHLLK